MTDLPCPHDMPHVQDCAICTDLAKQLGGYEVLIVQLAITPYQGEGNQVGLLETVCSCLLQNGFWFVWHPRHPAFWWGEHPNKHAAVLAYLRARLGEYDDAQEEAR